MINLSTKRLLLLLAPLAVLGFSSDLQADWYDDDDTDTETESHVIVIGDDSDGVTFNYEGGILKITSQDDGTETITEVDMQDIQEIVSDAMDEVSIVMDELSEMQLDVHVGRDNIIRMDYDSTIHELDIDELMETVSETIAEVMVDFEDEDWTIHMEDDSDVTKEDLEDELDDLRREMRDLKRELRSLRKRY